MEIFVPDCDWNSHWNSPEEAVKDGQLWGEYPEGYDFTMVRLTVGARSTYRIIDGVPVLTKLEFPKAIHPPISGD